MRQRTWYSILVHVEGEKHPYLFNYWSDVLDFTTDLIKLKTKFRLENWKD